MTNEIFEAHRERMEEDVKLAMDNKVICDHCGEVKDYRQTMSSVTDGTICFPCMCKQ
jgi:formylmethanofuran dehydrogenase subunit E